ncbi:hypothetical protein HHI36_011644 [Cryptolaemus montrouzieri]|uniref:Cytochrome P450 n=1 Tax=Cryptolaemus montrouzieri TaxID=559131 RepID=A0ABD2MN57_9CUCU
MFPLMKESVECFLQNFQDNEEKVIEIELKKTANAFIATSSASTYFGIDISSLKKLKDFLLTLGGMFTFGQGILHDFNYLIYAYAPVIAPLFGISSIIKKDAKQYFIKTLEDGLTRENNDIHRPDLIGLWIQKQKEEYDESFGENMKKKKTDLNRLNIVSQLCMFLLNSLDGSVTVLNFALYELAMNPDVQKKLIEEIDEINSQEIEPSYNIISGLQYMDMVISETMRKWPAIIVMERRCTKPYTINAKLPDEVPIHLDVGDIIIAPLYAIQMDPEYFPDPEKFDPERFSPSNRNDIKPYTYLPWGAGPRNCNGGKFALAQLKLFIFQLLSNFELVATESTPKNIKLLKKPGKLEPEEPVIVGLKRRKF